MVWRWTVGGTAGALFLSGVFEFLDSLPVSRGDAMLLRTKQPWLVARAVAHIVHGSLNRVVFASLVGGFAVGLLWIMFASIGRSVTVRALLEYVRSASNNSRLHAQASFRALVGLQFLRAAVALGAMLAFEGAGIFAGFASPETNPQPGLAFIFFTPLAGLICLTWYALNWLLSLAAIFAVRDGEDTLGAISAAATLVRERAGAISAVSTWSGLAHLAAFTVATGVISLPLGFIHVAPTRAVLAVVALLTLVYFAVADWLYIARLAGYVFIAELPEASWLRSPLPIAPASNQQLRPAHPVIATIDRDEPILSDLPLLYTGQPI
jgi:hypothetical protein